MTERRLRTAEERRADIRAHAATLKIDEAYISALVETFYARIRANEEIGPVFEQAIGDNWAVHLARMKSFWSSAILSTGQYSGKPVPAHFKHKTIRPEHFDIWLGLFRETLKETAPSQGAVSHFLERAERMAKSLKLALFGVPGIPRN